MSTLTQGRRAAEFILSEANGNYSRQNGVLISGQNLAAGTVLKASGSKLTAYTVASAPVGILLEATDASAGDVACAYIARAAEVKLALLTYPPDVTDEPDVIADLLTIGIVAREAS